MRKVKIYTVYSSFDLKRQAGNIYNQQQKTENLLRNNYARPNGMNILTPSDYADQKTREQEKINEIMETLPKNKFRYNGFFHCWKQASDEDSHWAIGIIEGADGWCHEEQCESIKFEEWK